MISSPSSPKSSDLRRQRVARLIAICGLLGATVLSIGAFHLSCADDDVGVPCDKDITAGEDKSSVQINSQALTCRSRLCILYGGYNQNVRPLCTAPCDSSSDCPDSTDTCPEGYSCVIGQAVEGGLQCCRVCVCKADLQGGGDQDPQASSCVGKPVKCPNI